MAWFILGAVVGVYVVVARFGADGQGWAWNWPVSLYKEWRYGKGESD